MEVKAHKRLQVICLGSGMAALHLALNIPDDVDLKILSAGTKSDCNSFMAKGGIAVPVDETDIGQHIQDTIVAGDGYSNPSVVKDIVTAAITTFNELRQKGISFDSHLALEGGHSKSRIRHIGDKSGFAIMKQLHRLVTDKTNVRFLYSHVLMDLLVADNRCYGVVVYNRAANKIKHYIGDAVVLATGGCAALFANHTNTEFANGEGHAIAARAGAHLKDMEFMQFHPTAIDLADHAQKFLITEAFRGAGAIIRDENNHAVMDQHPRGSLAPRDIISRTMKATMDLQGTNTLWLDYSDVSDKTIRKHFPALYPVLLSLPHHAQRKVAVAPAAHYMCGGIETNTYGKTSVENLFAIGEVACTGLHGANRLASNSLMELLVVSKRVAEQFNRIVPPQKFPEFAVNPVSLKDFSAYALELTGKIKSLMWNEFGILRSASAMENGKEQVQKWYGELIALKEPFAYNPMLMAMQNRLETCLFIAEQAIQRRNSIGCHYRVDEKEITKKVLQFTYQHA